MQYTFNDRVLALAGMFQALKLVQQVARTGMVDSAVFETSIKSLFTLDVASPESVFESRSNLKLGFETLIIQLGGGSQNTNSEFNSELTRYLINIMVLEKKLARNKHMLENIGTSIENAQSQVEHYSYTHDNVIANLADIYVNTVSTLGPKVMVNGEQNHLSNSSNVNKIRALLLAAVRSTVLWRQCGGTRWQLLLSRKKIIQTAETLLR